MQSNDSRLSVEKTENYLSTANFLKKSFLVFVNGWFIK